VTLQCISFHLPDWEGRIYLYEPGLYQHMQFPVCSGSGQRLSATLTCRLHRQLTLEVWGMLSVYHDRETLGSGNQQIDGSRKLGLQVRWTH
jgi:hypothetical protein